MLSQILQEPTFAVSGDFKWFWVVSGGFKWLAVLVATISITKQRVERIKGFSSGSKNEKRKSSDILEKQAKWPLAKD